MIRIGFDGRALASPAAGVRRYTRELFGALASLDGVRIVAVGAPDDCAVPQGVERALGALSLPSNAGWMLTGLPRAAGRARLDLFHAPSYTAPRNGPRPLVLTIHDVSYARRPEWYPYRRDPVRRAFYRWSARQADVVVTVSQFSRAEILAAYRLPPERVVVVPEAASGAFTPDPRAVRALFVLHVGDVHARRNLEVVVRALARVRRQHAALGDLRLVLAGVDRGQVAELEALARLHASGPPLLEVKGQVSEAALLDLYRTALALVYPSRYEGFGLPLLEAMACGTPVIASRASAIPEVTAEAARLLDPDDEAGWAEAIASVADPLTDARMRDAGLARAAEFSWRRTAELTLEVYRSALERRERREIRRTADRR